MRNGGGCVALNSAFVFSKKKGHVFPNPISYDGLNVVLFDLNINAANFPTTKIVKTKKKKTRKFTGKKDNNIEVDIRVNCFLLEVTPAALTEGLFPLRPPTYLGGRSTQ